MQTRALADCGAGVTLYACRSVVNEADVPAAIAAQYGVSTDGMTLVTAFARSSRGLSPRVASLAVSRLARGPWPELVICRNLYAAYVLGVLAARRMVFELHDIDTGWRWALQRAVLRQKGIRIISISHKLLEVLASERGIVLSNAQVLPDAAPAGIVPVPLGLRRRRLQERIPEAGGAWKAVCGYIGHLYAGRGIELIESLARRRPDMLFLVVGGQQADVDARRSANRENNLLFLGHYPHRSALQLAACVDVLLMPYQTSVSLGTGRYDTARWMSPMKMFEYMATGVPIVSSDLPVLREVLCHEQNALLVAPDDVDGWAAAIDRIAGDAVLAGRLGADAYAQYERQHTWEHRARMLLGA
jgi:glycosyltransferase involved in cell wall biosynthesis